MLGYLAGMALLYGRGIGVYKYNGVEVPVILPYGLRPLERTDATDPTCPPRLPDSLIIPGLATPLSLRLPVRYEPTQLREAALDFYHATARAVPPIPS